MMKHTIKKQLAKGEVMVGIDQHGCLVIYLATNTALGDLHARIRLSRSEAAAGYAVGYSPFIERARIAQEQLADAVENYNRHIEGILSYVPGNRKGVRVAARSLAAARLGNSHAQDDIVGAVNANPSEARSLLNKGAALLELLPPPSLENIYGIIESGVFTRNPTLADWVSYYNGSQHTAGSCCSACKLGRKCLSERN